MPENSRESPLVFTLSLRPSENSARPLRFLIHRDSCLAVMASESNRHSDLAKKQPSPSGANSLYKASVILLTLFAVFAPSPAHSAKPPLAPAKMRWSPAFCSLQLDSSQSVFERLRALTASERPSLRRQGEQLLYESIRLTLQSSFAFRLAGQEAEDLLQRTALSLLKALPRVHDETHLARLTHTAFRRNLISLRRRVHPFPRLLAYDLPEAAMMPFNGDKPPSPDEGLLAAELQNRFESALSEFSQNPQARRIIERHFSGSDSPPKQIAASLGISYGYYRKVLFRFRKNLAERLGLEPTSLDDDTLEP